MNRTEVLEQLAPCGLDCGRCIRFENGTLSRAAKVLKEGLQGFGPMAERMAQHVPALGGYPQFEAMVDFLSDVNCTGCRQGSTACLPTCTIRTCFREKGVDFCGDCADFPCEKSPYPGQFKQRWVEMNRRIHEVGAEQYYNEQVRKPRYGGI